jgi:uncharacterized membrane protein
VRDRQRSLTFEQEPAQSANRTGRTLAAVWGGLFVSSEHKRVAEQRSNEGLNSIIERNIHILMERRRQETESLSLQDRIALVITRFAGSMRFIYLHVVIFGVWIAINLGYVPAIHPFDPMLLYLATAATLEAIFLATFVLINQNRMSEAADKRAELHVQIGLLTEHELTRLLRLNEAIARKLGVQIEFDPAELEELKRDVAPEAVMDKLESADS